MFAGGSTGSTTTPQPAAAPRKSRSLPAFELATRIVIAIEAAWATVAEFMLIICHLPLVPASFAPAAVASLRSWFGPTPHDPALQRSANRDCCRSREWPNAAPEPSLETAALRADVTGPRTLCRSGDTHQVVSSYRYRNRGWPV